MAITNQTKPTTTLTNGTKISSGETWASITSSWASETRSWADLVSFMTDSAKPLNLVDSYSESNRVSDFTNIRSDFFSLVGQTFTPSSYGVLRSAVMYLSKLGTPTGTLTAKIYAITGTYGTDAKPTGSALATSNTASVTDLTSSLALITFTFPDSLTLSVGTNYALVLDASSVTGDASNYVQWGRDTTSPTHAGNEFFSNTGGVTYSTSSVVDLCFYVYEFGSAFTNATKIT